MIKAEYIDHMGDDLRVVNAARVSFDKESTWETATVDLEPENDLGLERAVSHKRLSARDARLIQYLAKHNHWTPSAHPHITLREHVPIFVARHRFRHVVGFVYNEVSRRYVDSDPQFYVPDGWRRRAENRKQGSSDELVDQNPKGWIEARYAATIANCQSLYNSLIEEGVCPEQARMVLPQSMMTSYYVTGSLAAFARAYRQRNDALAQREIQVLAAEWDRIIRPLFPVSWAALVDGPG